MRRPLLLSGFLIAAVACTDQATGDAATRAGASPTGNASASGGPTGTPAIAPGGTITGALREQIPVGPYVYVRLETVNGELWAAVNQEPLTIGSTVTVHNVMLMEQFQSPSLNRTFERIYFGSLQPTGTMPGGGAEPPAAMASPGTPAATDAKVGAIARAAGPNARTIGELWAAKRTAAGTAVTVRGVVVKYNAGVMGKNWIHLQDGSGTAAAGTNDLAVTTQDAAAIGDTITISGTVRIDRDFGAGYTYPLLVEDAKVAKGAR